MNIKMRQIRLLTGAALAAASLAGLLPVSTASAQPAGSRVENRLLLVFGTSADMKKRLPAVQKSLDNLFMLGMDQEFRPGDSIGVWTLSKEVHAGQFPLMQWSPEDAATMTERIGKFLKKQRYGGTADLNALLPVLDRVVATSPRLTVLIFCDGTTEIHGTPYASGINRLFQQRRAEQQKQRAPFILLLRSQLGQYTGCTMSFPFGAVNFPPFPPWPQPTNLPPPAPVIPPPPPLAPPLILINTNRHITPPAPPPAPAVTNPVASVAPPAPETPTNALAAVPPPAPPPAAPTNGPVASTENPGQSGSHLLGTGAVLLLAAGALVILIWRQSRAATRPSLITRSMDGDRDSSPPRR